MSTIVNKRDVLLHTTTPRLIDTGEGGNLISLTATSPVFKVSGGTGSPAAIVLTAFPANPAWTVNWAIVTGTATLTGTGNTRTLTYANMATDNVAIQVSVSDAYVVDGITLNTPTTYTDIVNITKVLDGTAGANGFNGQRGSLNLYASGSTWSDATANAAVQAATGSAAKVIGDVVTISNGGTFAAVKGWSGTAWIPTGQVIDGSLIVTNSVKAAAIDTTGLTLRDAAGSVFLKSGAGLSFGDRFANTSGVPENGATVGASWSTNLVGKPDDALNLVTKSTFEDGSYGDWTISSGQVIDVGAEVNQLFKKAMMCLYRDTYEISNEFPVNPGEIIYFEADIDTSSQDYWSNVGLHCFNNNGGTSAWSVGISKAPRTTWEKLKGSLTVPANTVKARPWIQIDGPGGVQLPPTLVTNIRITRFQLGATVGARAGINLKDASGAVIYDNDVKNAVLVPIINKAAGENLWTGDLSSLQHSFGEGAVLAATHPDPRGTDTAVVLSLPTSLAFAGWRAHNQNGAPDAVYKVTLKVKVVAGMSIVISTTDASTWAGSNYVIATTTSTTPVWVAVSIQQRVVSTAAGVDVLVGANFEGYRVASTIGNVAVCDLVVTRDESLSAQNPITGDNVNKVIGAGAGLKNVEFVPSINAAQGAANTALSNASSAQGAANTALSNASSAQGTADTALSNANNAQSTANNALNAANSANNSLGDKLSKSAGDVLTGQISLQASGAIVVGNAGFSNGNFSGTGVVVSPNGIASIAGGAAKFVLYSDGNAYFGGSMYAGNININNKFIVNADGSTIIKSATSGQRMELTSSLLQVFDGNGTLRVRLGVW
jgi:hypothetical protein